MKSVFNSISAKQRQDLQAIADDIAKLVRAHDPKLYYAAFLEMRGYGQVIYLANGDRPEVCRLLTYWVEHTSFEPGIFDPNKRVTGKKREESAAEATGRVQVEEQCAEVGRQLTKKWPVALFFFKNNEDCPGGIGINTHFVSMRKARQRIADWLKRQDFER